MKDKEKQIEEMANCYNCVCKPVCIKTADINKEQELLSWNEYVKQYGCKHYQPKLPKDSVVLSMEELKRLETNYKIGLGKSQSWCKSLKNRIEELEKENFKLKVDNEVLKEEKEQFENDVCNYEMNLQHITEELQQSSKETAEKIYHKIKIKVLTEDMAKDRPQTLYRFTSFDIMKKAREIVEEFGVVFENGHTTIKE